MLYVGPPRPSLGIWCNNDKDIQFIVTLPLHDSFHYQQRVRDFGDPAGDKLGAKHHLCLQLPLIQTAIQDAGI